MYNSLADVYNNSSQNFNAGTAEGTGGIGQQAGMDQRQMARYAWFIQQGLSPEAASIGAMRQLADPLEDNAFVGLIKDGVDPRTASEAAPQRAGVMHKEQATKQGEFDRRSMGTGDDLGWMNNDVVSSMGRGIYQNNAKTVMDPTQLEQARQATMGNPGLRSQVTDLNNEDITFANQNRIRERLRAMYPTASEEQIGALAKDAAARLLPGQFDPQAIGRAIQRAIQYNRGQSGQITQDANAQRFATENLAGRTQQREEALRTSNYNTGTRQFAANPMQNTPDVTIGSLQNEYKTKNPVTGV
jgi:hypothetical protein